MHSSEAHSALAHHFDDLSQQREACTLGMWAFLATEVLFFGGLFAAYVVYRFSYPAAFAEASRHLAKDGNHLGLILGAINTGVLLLSSYTVALSVHAAQTNRRRRLVQLLTATAVLGLAFLAIKGVEYSHKFEHRLVPGADFEFPASQLEAAQIPRVELFYCLYFVMTGFHALHVLVGVGALGVTACLVWKNGIAPRYPNRVEIVGLYWHFVDIVWVFLFPLLYLAGGL